MSSVNPAAELGGRILNRLLEIRVLPGPGYTEKQIRLWFDRRILTFIIDDLSYTVSSFQFEAVNPKEITPKSLDRTEYSNDSDTPDVYMWRTAKASTDSFSLSFEETLEIDTKVKAGFSFIIGGEINTDLTLKSGQCWTSTIEKTWAEEFTVNLPPRSLTSLTLLLHEGKFNTSFTAQLVATGSFVRMFLRPPVGEGASEPLYALNDLLSPAERSFPIKGTFNGVAGLYTRIDKKQVPLARKKGKFKELDLLEGLPKPDLSKLLRMAKDLDKASH